MSDARQKSSSVLTLAEVWDAVQQAVIVTDPSGKIVHWNTHAEVMYGWSAREVIGRPVLEVTPTDLSRTRGAEILALLLSGRNWSGRYGVETRSGMRFLAQVSLSPLVGKDGEILGTLGFSLPAASLGDEHEARSGDSEEMLAAALRASNDAVVLFRLSDQTIVDVNDPWLKLTGLSRAAAIGRKQNEFSLWGTPDANKRFEEQFSADGYVRNFRFSFQYSSGEQRVAVLSADTVVVGGETLVMAAGRDITKETNAEAALLEAAEQYQTLFENTIDAVVLAAPDGRVITANPATVAMFGWSVEELQQHGIDVVIGPDVPERQEAARQLASSGRYSGRQTLTRRDGTTLLGDVTVSRFHDRRGAARSTVVIRDVTQAAKARQALEAAEVQFRTLVEHALVGVYIIRNGRHVYVNPELTRILGYDQAALLSMPVIDLVIPEDRPRVAASMKDRSGSLKYQFRVRRGDGVIIHVEVHGSMIDDDDGPALIGTAIDITEREKASEELRQSETRYRTLIEEAQDIIFTCDLNGTITSLNHAFEEITGWKREEWIGRSFQEVLEPESVHDAEEHFESILDQSSSARRESRLRTSTGHPVLIEGTARTLVVAGHVVGTLGIARDITERRKLEIALERSGRFTALGRLAATLAHEFNNVLMGIQMSADLLTRTGDPAAVRTARAIGASVDRGRRMTQEVLRFTKMPDPELEVIRVPELIESLIPELESLLGGGVRVIFEVREEGQELSIAADRGQIHQVFTNLAINARDAMSAKGTITLTVAEHRGGDRGMVAIGVRDTGSGIAPDMLPLIFEPLFTTKKSGGTGLGLSIVSQIIARHGGTIDATSKLGEGTCFEILLPLVANIDEVHTAEPPRQIRPIERLLIVDDDEAVSAGISAVLELEGVTTQVAALGGEAEAAVERFSPEAVLLDLNLPDMNGREVHRRLLARWPSLPIIISSGHADETTMREITSIGRSAFLLKPYDIETLLRTIAEVRGVD